MPNKLTLTSWNVNGLRAAVKNGFGKFLTAYKPDIICLQEVKMDEAARVRTQFDFPGYEEWWNPAKRPGYSGTAMLIREKLPLEIIDRHNGLSQEEFDEEGRAQTIEFPKFFLLNCYFPHTRHDLSRLSFKLKFNDAVLAYTKKLVKKKPLVITGDFNVAHEEIDLTNPKENEENPGFLPQEREWMTKFLQTGFVDTFRHFYPQKVQYTWWTYRFGARRRNIGWRIDYFCVSKSLLPNVKSAFIWDKVIGSDHCPVGIMIEI